MKKEIVISTASMAAVINGLGELSKNDITAEVDDHGNFEHAVSDATTRASVQTLIRNSATTIAKTVRIDSELLEERYDRMARENGDDEASGISVLLKGIPRETAYLDDSEESGRGSSSEFSFSCYNNCHSACHGSGYFT